MENVQGKRTRDNQNTSPPFCQSQNREIEKSKIQFSSNENIHGNQQKSS